MTSTPSNFGRPERALGSRSNSNNRSSNRSAWYAGVAAAAALLLLSGCQRQQEPPFSFEEQPAVVTQDASDTVASVNGRRITAEMVRERIRRGGLQHNWTQRSPEQKRELLEEMIRTEVLAAAAERAGFDQDPRVLDEYKQILGHHYWRAQLKQFGEGFVISPEQVRAFYDAHPERFAQPRRTRGAVIWISAPRPSEREDEGEMARLRDRAQRALEEARALPATERFLGEVARRYSSDKSSGRRGGDIGWIVEEGRSFRWEPAVVEALFELDEPGDLSSIVEGEFGLYIVKLVDRDGGGLREFSEVARSIYGQLLKEREDAVKAKLFEVIRGEMQIEIDYDALEAAGAQIALAGSSLRPPPLPGEPERTPEMGEKR